MTAWLAVWLVGDIIYNLQLCLIGDEANKRGAYHSSVLRGGGGGSGTRE